MTITLDLKPEELTILNDRAQAQGVDIETVLHSLVGQIAPVPAQEVKPQLTKKNSAAIALMNEWIAEKDRLSDGELEQNDRDFEDFKANINRWRAEEGRPPAL